MMPKFIKINEFLFRPFMQMRDAYRVKITAELSAWRLNHQFAHILTASALCTFPSSSLVAPRSIALIRSAALNFSNASWAPT